MSCCHGSLERQQAETRGDRGGPSHHVPEGSKDSNVNGARGHSCDILAKNLDASVLFSKNILEGKLKSNGLISFVEGISRQHSAEFVAGHYAAV